MMGDTITGTNFNGDANTMCRISLGGYTSNTTGNMTSRGIGIKKVGGSSQAVVLTVHDGTTLTDTTSSYTYVTETGFYWMIYSDGAGNVTLYINGSSVATSTGGPTSSASAIGSCYIEQVEAPTTPSARQIMQCAGGWFYCQE